MISPRFNPVSFRRALLLLAAALLLPAGSLRAQDDSAPPDNAVAAQNTRAVDNTAASDNNPASDNTNPASDNTNPASGDTDAASQSDLGYSQPVESGVQGLERVPSLPPGSFGDQQPGIPYSSILNSTGADVNDIDSLEGSPFHTGIFDPANIGTAEGSFSIQTGNGGLLIPFLHSGGEPQDADIKAGPFFIKFHSLDGLVLYDDNYQRSEDDRKSELLVLMGLNLSVIAQLADNLQFVVSGSIVYLPLQNQFGVEGSAYNSLGLLLYAAPVFASQLVYDTMIAGWPVRFADDFRVGTGSYDTSYRDNFDLFQGGYVDRDEAGRYTFVSGHTQPGSNTPTALSPNLNESVVYFSNNVSALTDRLLPGDVRLTVRLDRDDLWYNQNNRGLPSSRDDLYVSAISERENLRFKPYASYEATYVQGSPGITQIFRAGVFGPIDDQLFLRAEAGYYIGVNEHQDVLYRLTLNHDAGPYTTEYLSLDRDLNYFDQEERTSEYYNLNQILGPTLVANLFLANASYRDLIGDGSSHTDDLGGAQLTWNIGPKTTLQLAGIFDRQTYPGGQRDDIVTGRAILNRIITDSLTFQLLYQYQRDSSNRPGDSYYENLVYFRIIKLLP